MSASLHLARLSPRHTGRMLRSFRRHHQALLADPDVEFARLYMLAELDPYVGGLPTPTRWGLLIGFSGAGARDTHRAAGGAARPLVDGAQEAWSVSLDPIRVRPGDELHGWRPAVPPSPPGAPRPGAEEPVVVMTHGRVHPRHLPVFSRWNAAVAREIVDDPAMQMHVGGLDHLFTRATFSVWRTRREMADFAYRNELHATAAQRSLTVPWGHSWFFARFRPSASDGTWNGVDPLAEATPT